jgi:hypothetical protein
LTLILSIEPSGSEAMISLMRRAARSVREIPVMGLSGPHKDIRAFSGEVATDSPPKMRYLVF